MWIYTSIHPWSGQWEGWSSFVQHGSDGSSFFPLSVLPPVSMTHEASAFSLLEIRIILFLSWAFPSFSMYRHIHKPTYIPTISQGYITSCCLFHLISTNRQRCGSGAG